jgi:ABC-type nitrate/sulfonate/bicarbonate transport system substrate-binding protein
MRRLFLTVSLPATLLLFGVFTAASIAADKIRIAVVNYNVSSLTAGIAEKRDYFKQEGLQVELIRMRPPVSVAALSSGEIDSSMICGSAIRAALRGVVPLKIIATFMNGSNHALIVHPRIQTVRDLKGKTLGIGAIGDTTHLAARVIFKANGLDLEKDVKVLAVGADPARLAAMKENLITATLASPPADVEGKRIGFKVLLRTYEVFRFPTVSLCTTDTKIKQRRQEIKRTLKALIRAQRFLVENRAGAIQVLMDWAKTDKESASAAYDASIEIFSPDGSGTDEGLRFVVDEAAQEAKLRREISLREIADDTLLREVHTELGIQRR